MQLLLLPLIKPDFAFLGEFVDVLFLILLALEWLPAHHQRIDYDPQREHVAGLVIPILDILEFEDFWCHKPWCPAFLVQVSRVAFGGQSKVSEHPLSRVLSLHDVGGLQIPVHYVLGVEVLQGRQGLLYDGVDLLAGEVESGAHVVLQRAPAQVLQDQVHQVLCFVHSVYFYNVIVPY